VRKQILQAKGQSAKVHQTCEALRRMAREAGPGGQLPTIRALCSQLGVSLATMNSALALLERQKVLWRRHGSGIYVAETLHQRHIGVICDPVASFLFGASPFWSLLVENTHRQAQEQGLRISMHFAGDYPPRVLDYPHDPSPLSEDLIRSILDGSLHGVLSIGVEHSVTRWIEAQGVPVVSIAGPSNYIITQDYGTAARMGVEELARMGCRRIGLWQPVVNFYPSHIRRVRHAFDKAMRAQKLERDESLDAPEIAPHAGHKPSSMEAGYWGAMQFFDENASTRARRSRADWPDGVVIMDDMMAQGVFMALDQLGIKPGRDIKVAAFAVAESPVLLPWEKSIARMEFSLHEIVTSMLEGVLSLADGRQPRWIKKARPADPKAVEMTYNVLPKLHSAQSR
jgi:DNA-binding LacI/PurR family transcriptional regulator